MDAWDVVGLHTTASVWNVPKKYGPYGELCFFLIKEEPTIYEKVVGFGRADEVGEHNVENFILCSLAQHACSPLLRRF